MKLLFFYFFSIFLPSMNFPHSTTTNFTYSHSDLIFYRSAAILPGYRSTRSGSTRIGSTRKYRNLDIKSSNYNNGSSSSSINSNSSKRKRSNNKTNTFNTFKNKNTQVNNNINNNSNYNKNNNNNNHNKFNNNNNNNYNNYDNNNNNCNTNNFFLRTEFDPTNYIASTFDYINESSIKLGVLASYKSSKLFLGAASLAVSAVNSDPSLLQGRTLQLVMSDVGNSGSEAHAALSVTRMLEMLREGVIAFIGPDDNCANEALVAAAWNMPMISYKCADKQVSNKTKFYTFARTLPPSSKVVKALVALLQKFHWRKFVLLTEITRGYSQIAEAFKSLAAHHNLKIIGESLVAHNYTTLLYSSLEAVVKTTKDRTRIYIVLASLEVQWDFMLALNKSVTSRLYEYVVIAVDDDKYENVTTNVQKIRIPGKSDPTFDYSSITASFFTLLKISPAFSYVTENYLEFENQVKELTTSPPVCLPIPESLQSHIQVPIFAAHLFDAVTVYARALDESLKEGGDPRNGTDIMRRIRGHVFPSIQGLNISIDENGDAEGSFILISIGHDEENPNFLGWRRVGEFVYQKRKTANSWENVPKLILTKKINWLGKSPPRDEPPCGFDGCKRDWMPVVIWMAVALFIVFILVLFLRHLSYDRKLARLLWKIDAKEVKIIDTKLPGQILSTNNMIRVYRQSMLAEERVISPELEEEEGEEEGKTPKMAFCPIGIYKGNIVAIKTIQKKSLDLTRNIKKELTMMRDIRHENLLPFVGASVESSGIKVFTAYCARGSLWDVLNDPELQLDSLFVASLVSDLIKGMIYLQDSEIIYHGNLRSGNCLIDSRWILQISDFGLRILKGQEVCPNPQKKLWWSPEQLRSPIQNLKTPQKVDVFAFGIVLYEIVGRKGPWGSHTDRYSVHEIIMRMASVTEPSIRPPLDDLKAQEYVHRCLYECWAENPEERPDFKFIRIRLKEMHSGLKLNIVDNMLAMLEKHAYNLEAKVQQRTHQLMEEKKKTEALLLRMLPKPVADALKRGERVSPESFNNVTIYFSDIVGFTSLSAQSSPLQIVDLLNELYTCFDAIIGDFDVYKVETIGDAYMVVSGLPIRNGDRHAGEIATMALNILDAVKHFPIRHMPGETLKLRIGLHSGPCVAGVVGLTMPRYCLFGDTVNTASRMESAGEPLKIHISEANKNLLDILGGYEMSRRGITPIKGKGLMETWWLEGKKQSEEFEGENILESQKITENTEDSSPEFLHHSEGIILADVTPGLYVQCNDKPDLLNYRKGRESFT